MVTDELDTSAYDRTRPLRRPDVRSYSLGTETLLYDPTTDTAHAINASAMAIWDLCDGSRTIAEISVELGSLLGQDGAGLIADVRHGVKLLRDLGLLATA